MGLAELRPRREAVRERLGRVLDGRFRLEACLGAGGTGAVYRARTLAVAVVEGEGPRLPAPPLPPVVAVKILHPDLVADAARRELFLKEARIAALVDHPGVVKVFDARVAADGTAYLVLELIAGKCLETAIVGWGDLLVDEVVRVTRGILEILAVAHEAGVVHCDVKPENVLVMDDGSVKLLDFGVARITGDARRVGVAGTADFMAPEQARGEWSRVDARADVWSVGATFYRLIAGHSLPDPASGDVAAWPEIVFPDDVPAPIAEVMRRALANDPADRFPNARAMLEALARAAVRSGLPRTPRTLPAASPFAGDGEIDEAPQSRVLFLVPPYPVGIAEITPIPRPVPTPVPPPRAEVVPLESGIVTRRRRLKGIAMAAAVVAAAGLLGALLALVVTPGSVLERGTRARVPQVPVTTEVTSGAAPR